MNKEEIKAIKKLKETQDSYLKDELDYAIEAVVNLIEKQQKENKELREKINRQKKQLCIANNKILSQKGQLKVVNTSYIPKSKIIELVLDYSTPKNKYERVMKYDVVESFLDELEKLLHD